MKQFYHLTIIIILCGFFATLTAQNDPGHIARQFFEQQIAGNGQPPDQLNSLGMQKREFLGQNAYDYFGYSVASAGDVNGDGYDDIIVGAYANDDNGNAAGKVYIYFGASSIDMVPDLVLTGEASGDWFGFSVAGAGDVNGDGYGDVLVGAMHNSENESNAGKAYLFLGGSAMDNLFDLEILGEAVDDYFGRTVAGAGDVNGDGYDDIILSSHLNDESYTDAGKVYLYFGGSSMDNIADLTMTGEASYDYFGRDIAGAGDLNGDGYDDIVVGAPFNNQTGVDAGKVYVYFGGSTMDTDIDLWMTGENAGDALGYTVSGAGDVNGDGYDDLGMSATNNDDTGTNAGKAYLFFGGADMDYTADVTFSGEAADDNFGHDLAAAGDVNGDGYGDILISSIYHDQVASNAGKVYFYYGNKNMDAIPDLRMSGEDVNDYAGFSVSSAGDVNGDGYADLLYGIHRSDELDFDAGKVYLLMQRLGGHTSQADLFMYGETTNDNFGYSVSDAGDVNGDGYCDIIVGSPNADDDPTLDAGKAYIYYGGPVMDNFADVIMTGEAFADRFGYSVSSAGDVNGDGYSDVIIGAHYNDQNGTSAGKVYIFYGGSTMDNTADVTMTGDAAGDQFGVSVSSAGDINGDGYGDVIVGAWNNDQNGNNAGAAYLFFGGSAMDNLYDVAMGGRYADDYFGQSVSSAGDINGDGYGDVIIGAPMSDVVSLIDAGNAYIYYGGPDMDNNPDVIISGEEAGDRMGTQVTSAGDVNGDGFGDIIAGLNDLDKVLLFYGGDAMDNMNDLTIAGHPNEHFGISVSAAGDINMDGYGDVIVGAYLSDDVAVWAGKAYIFHGGIAMDNSADVTIIGEAYNDQFGISVSSAGDVNGDGSTDIIIGAAGNDDLDVDAGKAYIYFASNVEIKPNLFYSADVPHDQGGMINLKWSRCAFDNPVNGQLSHYLIQRSDSRINGHYAWNNLTEIPASGESYYSYSAETDYDSTSQTSARFFYRISAIADDEQIWQSNITSAYSVDNLSPSPSGFLKAIQEGNNSVQLTWERNRIDPDVQNYAVYRSLETDFIPDADNFLTSTTDTSFLDLEPYDQQDSFYKVITIDIHENPSIASPEAAIFFDSSLPVSLSTFSATATTNAQVRVDFVTASEINVLGFNIWRAFQKDGDYQLVASYLDYSQLVGQGNSAQGAAYSWTDVHTESNHEYWYKLECANLDGSSEFYKAVSARVLAVPTKFALRPNYPNPFNPETIIEYHLPVTSDGQIVIYNLLGQQIKAIEFQDKEPGIYKYTFDGAGLPSGLYIYRFSAQGDYHGKKRVFSRVRKMVLVK